MGVATWLSVGIFGNMSVSLSVYPYFSLSFCLFLFTMDLDKDVLFLLSPLL